MNISWLTKRTSIEELGNDWGHLKRDWDALRAKMVEGDELWRFAHQGGPLAAQLGVALKRGDRIIGHIVTLRS